MTYRHLSALLVLAGILAWATAASAGAERLNGRWVVDADQSQEFEEAAEAFNRQLNEEKRRHSTQKFDRKRSSGRGAFHAQAEATLEMIKEDSRSISWSVPEEVRTILDAESIKLYKARMCAILYDGEVKRLLAINPAGRAYSVSGTEITDDAIGRSLTYVDGDALVIDTKLHGGDKLLEHYAVDADAGRMTATIQLERRGIGQPLEFVRVYTRDE